MNQLLQRIGLRVFLLAWIVDIMYDAVAPATWGHFGYWTAVLAVVGFHIAATSLAEGFANSLAPLVFKVLKR